jgi:hypothetical protein
MSKTLPRVKVRVRVRVRVRLRVRVRARLGLGLGLHLADEGAPTLCGDTTRARTQTWGLG